MFRCSFDLHFCFILRALETSTRRLLKFIRNLFSSRVHRSRRPPSHCWLNSVGIVDLIPDSSLASMKLVVERLGQSSSLPVNLEEAL